jgi:hypothetical protein
LTKITAPIKNKTPFNKVFIMKAWIYENPFPFEMN